MNISKNIHFLLPQVFSHQRNASHWIIRSHFHQARAPLHSSNQSSTQLYTSQSRIMLYVDMSFIIRQEVSFICITSESVLVPWLSLPSAISLKTKQCKQSYLPPLTSTFQSFNLIPHLFRFGSLFCKYTSFAVQHDG